MTFWPPPQPSPGTGEGWGGGQNVMLATTLIRYATAVALAYSLAEPYRTAVRKFDVELPDLPPACDGLCIAQISDIHAGLWMPRSLIRRIVKLCAACNPNVVVLTGDVVTRRKSYPPGLRQLARTVTDYAADLAQELEVLRPQFGIYAVPGNHDLCDGDFGPIAEILARADVVSLLDKNTRLDNGLPLIGVDDLRAGCPDIQAATAGVSVDEAQIVLSHNPRMALLFRGRNALILSGHTHGGQVAVPARFRVAPVDAGQSFFQRGWYQVGRAKLYVSCGAGTIGVPMRLGVRPEIAVFTLRAAASG